jgi:UDP-glucose 4-epimerase
MLLDAGHRVCVFDNLERGHRAAVDPRARFAEGDLRDAGRIRGVMAEVSPDAVMHFAAYALVGESMDRPEMYFGNNVAGGLNLAEAMRRSGTRKIIFSSTCATYGVPERHPITEDVATRPANPYGESKLMLEKALEWYGRAHGMEVLILRYFNAAGATEKFGEDHDPEPHLIPNVLGVALGRQSRVRIFGDDYATPDGTCVRDYIHIVDLAQAHILGLASGKVGVYNLGNGSGYSVREVLAVARKVTGHRIPARVAARRPGDPDRLVADATRARTELGWRPRYGDLPEIVRSAWEWARGHPTGYEDPLRGRRMRRGGGASRRQSS